MIKELKKEKEKKKEKLKEKKNNFLLFIKEKKILKKSLKK